MSYYNHPWEPPSDPPPPAPKITAGFQASGLEERVIIPGLKGLIVALPAALLIGALIGAFKIKLPAGWAMIIAFLAVFLLSFLATSARGQWLIERLTGADLNLDGFVGEPAPRLALPEPEKVTIELVQNRGQIGQRGDDIDLPYPEKLPAFAQAVLTGRQYSQAVMVGTGKLFKRDEYDTLINSLVGSGLMYWKNPDHHNLGAAPTAAGKVVLRHFLPPPTPTDEEG